MSDVNELPWLDSLPEIEEEALSAFSRVNYGKLNLTPRFIRWDTVEQEVEGKIVKKRVPVEVDYEESKTLEGRQRSQEIIFAIDIREFNASLEFDYERRVQIGGADWRKTLRPSLEELFGAGADIPNVLRGLNGKYVLVEDVPQQPRRGQTAEDVQYNTIKFLKVYESREQCYKEYVERFGQPAEGTAPVPTEDVPGWCQELADKGWTVQTWHDYLPEIKQAVDAEDGPPPVKHAAVAKKYDIPVTSVQAAAS